MQKQLAASQDYIKEELFDNVLVFEILIWQLHSGLFVVSLTDKWLKGVTFSRNCGATSVGEYNRLS